MGSRTRTWAIAAVVAFAIAIVLPAAASAHNPTRARGVGSRSAAPAHLQAKIGPAKTSLRWHSGGVSGFAVEQATNQAMTTGRRVYRIRGTGRQFTPYGLTRGRTYYFRVRALNGGTPSKYSSTVRVVARTAEQPVTVMTYNILEAKFDGRHEGGNVVAPWSRRRPAAARLIRQADPDVVGIQEGASWVRKARGPRQVDSLRAALRGKYKLAHTEIPPSRRHFHRTGDYILYKKSRYQARGHGGHWALGDSRFAAYQVLRNRATGARMLFVSAHLLVTPGAASDARREAETRRLIHRARPYAARRHVPIVYVGDFNSDRFRRHSFNGPAMAMRAAGVADAWDAAQHRTRARYNTADHYMRKPPRNGARIDYVFAPAGVAVRSWGLVMNLSHGRFVGTIASDHNPLVARLEIPYHP
jgi:endonuclease/exonuclease/phosphatase family metal-dependent hydrolase